MLKCCDCGKKLNVSGSMKRSGFSIFSRKPVDAFGDLLTSRPRACMDCGKNFCSSCAALVALESRQGSGYYFCPVCGKSLGEFESQPTVIRN